MFSNRVTIIGLPCNHVRASADNDLRAEAQWAAPLCHKRKSRAMPLSNDSEFKVGKECTSRIVQQSLKRGLRFPLEALSKDNLREVNGSVFQQQRKSMVKFWRPRCQEMHQKDRSAQIFQQLMNEPYGYHHPHILALCRQPP